MASLELKNIELDQEIDRISSGYEKALQQLEVEVSAVGAVVKVSLNYFFLNRGESFATAVVQNRISSIGFVGLEKSVESAINDGSNKDWEIVKKKRFVEIISRILRELMTEPTEVVQNHLRSKADAYTLFAFLEQTPDIQNVMKKLITDGIIWLDTIIILPLLVESLYQENYRRFSHMLSAAVNSGFQLKCTGGVIEEVDGHLRRCLSFSRIDTSRWVGSVPFVAEGFLKTGQPLSGMAQWLEQFRGNHRSEDDIAEYLQRFHKISTASLLDELESAPEDLRQASREIWFEERKMSRDKFNNQTDDNTLLRIADHDVENFVGVLQARKKEDKTIRGYRTWWLTLDSLAFRMYGKLRDGWNMDIGSSPVMSADFLANYLSVGPARSRSLADDNAILPVALDVGLVRELTPQLILEAEKIRKESESMNEHVIRRRVRDSLDSAKRTIGEITQKGVEVTFEEM
jgi:hypothetical protein